MKILTNVRFYHLAGISQTVQSFMSFAKRQEKDEVVGINLLDASLEQKFEFQKNKNNFAVINKKAFFPNLENVSLKCQSINDLLKEFEPFISLYRQIIKQVKPDAILINGTYFLPWSFYMASLDFNIPIFLHYHGVLTKEIAHLKKERRQIFEKMEKTFYSPKVFYIFPSWLAKQTVENEVFHAKLNSGYTILPNPVFFKPTKPTKTLIKKRKNIGAVSRWTEVKNPHFFSKIARYDLKKGDYFDFHIVTDLEKKSEKYKTLEKFIKIRRSMRHKNLASYYQNMDLILCPSHFETYGNVAQEAIVHGTPSLVSKNMGISEVFERYGLQKWVIDFHEPSKVHKKCMETTKEFISFDLRKQIANDLSPDKIHSKLFEVLRSS